MWRFYTHVNLGDFIYYTLSWRAEVFTHIKFIRAVWSPAILKLFNFAHHCLLKNNVHYSITTKFRYPTPVVPCHGTIFPQKNNLYFTDIVFRVRHGTNRLLKILVFEKPCPRNISATMKIFSISLTQYSSH